MVAGGSEETRRQEFTFEAKLLKRETSGPFEDVIAIPVTIESENKIINLAKNVMLKW